jgi:hypothetical protein
MEKGIPDVFTYRIALFQDGKRTLPPKRIVRQRQGFFEAPLIANDNDTSRASCALDSAEHIVNHGNASNGKKYFVLL